MSACRRSGKHLLDQIIAGFDPTRTSVGDVAALIDSQDRFRSGHSCGHFDDETGRISIVREHISDDRRCRPLLSGDSAFDNASSARR
jgi:hypothetical protein